MNTEDSLQIILPVQYRKLDQAFGIYSHETGCMRKENFGKYLFNLYHSKVTDSYAIETLLFLIVQIMKRKKIQRGRALKSKCSTRSGCPLCVNNTCDSLFYTLISPALN